MKNKKLMGNLMLLLTAMIWGTAFVFQRKGMESIEPITFTAVRMTMAAVVISLTAFLANSKRKADDKRSQEELQKSRKETILGGTVCGILLAAASIFQQKGLVYTAAGKAGFITAMYILLVPIINTLLFRKKNPMIVWVSVLIGVFGMYLLCVTGDLRLTHGDLLVSVCAVLFSFQILCCDHCVRFGDPLVISAIQASVCAVISLISAFLLEDPSWEKVIPAAVPILYCGIVSGGIGYTLQMAAQKYTDPATASLLMSLESVFAAVAGALLLHEQMSVREIAGCVTMFIAIILVQLPHPEK